MVERVEPDEMAGQQGLEDAAARTVGLQLSKDNPEGEEGRVGQPVGEAEAKQDEAPCRHVAEGAGSGQESAAEVGNGVEDAADEDGQNGPEGGREAR